MNHEDYGDRRTHQMHGSILIVEDDDSQVLLLERALKQAGIQATTDVVDDGRAALDFFERCVGGTGHRPDLVLLDLNLPRLSGLDVLKWLRAQPLLRRLPVVVLTASDADTDISAAYDLGANSYLVKPRGLSRLDDLARRIREYWLEANVAPPLITDAPTRNASS